VIFGYPTLCVLCEGWGATILHLLCHEENRPAQSTRRPQVHR
jgi:hypothetical protein